MWCISICSKPEMDALFEWNFQENQIRIQRSKIKMKIIVENITEINVPLKITDFRSNPGLWQDETGDFIFLAEMQQRNSSAANIAFERRKQLIQQRSCAWRWVLDQFFFWKWSYMLIHLTKKIFNAWYILILTYTAGNLPWNFIQQWHVCRETL